MSLAPASLAPRPPAAGDEGDVFGDIYWNREPAPSTSRVPGETREDHLDHAGNVAAAGEEGLLPLYRPSPLRRPFNNHRRHVVGLAGACGEFQHGRVE